MDVTQRVPLHMSENFVELDSLRRDRAYLILHVHRTENTNRLILKLQENSDRQFNVFLPQCYNGQFNALDIFEINTKKKYYKLLHLGRCFCPAQSIRLEFIPYSPSEGFRSSLGCTY
jgi:hypothetical protein